jgi:hypothetical protein
MELSNTTTGYSHALYAEALAEFGEPRHLPACDGWILTRPIPHCPDHDAMGCYPLFTCCDWSRLPDDLATLRAELVSLTLVTDPFGDYDLPLLESCFDKVVHFKDHFVTDLSVPAEQIVSRSRRKEVRQALRRISVEVCPTPLDYLNDWCALYSHLTKRHGLRGIQAFSATSFAKQLRVPGLVLFRTEADGKTVGMHLWYQQGGVAYSHLSAYSAAGYALGASSALYAAALDYFPGKVRWLALGAGAGTSGEDANPLTDYKRDWATGSRPVYLCGRIFQPERYAVITQGKGIGTTNYFPAYRSGEFGS